MDHRSRILPVRTEHWLDRLTATRLTRAASAHDCQRFRSLSREPLNFRPRERPFTDEGKAWNSLGLKLKRDYNQFNGLQGARSLYPYSVHHHQQHSGLIKPDQVPCAYFSALSCIFTFGAPDTEGIKHSGNFVVNTPPHRKSKIATLQVPPSNLRAIIGIPHIYSLPSAAQKTRLERLTHTALHLILGSKKRIAGMRTLNHAGSTPVLEIAPAVWSSQYFQVCQGTMTANLQI